MAMASGSGHPGSSDVVLHTQADQHLHDHADADGLDKAHNIAHDLALPELVEEDGRGQRQGQGRAEDAQNGRHAAAHAGSLGAWQRWRS